jgi:hypothetical protein
MKYSDLKFKRKIGDEVFIIKDNLIIKTNIIGIKIQPYPNQAIKPIIYGFEVLHAIEVIWCDEEIVFTTIDEALKIGDFEVIDCTITYEDLGTRNSYKAEIDMLVMGYE